MHIRTSTNNNTDTTKASDTSSTATSSSDTGWISLFDGQDLNGWHTYGKSERVLHGMLTAARFISMLQKERQIQAVAAILSAMMNSAILILYAIGKFQKLATAELFSIRMKIPLSTKKHGTRTEMQVLDNAGHPDAKIPKHRAGDLYDLISCSQETVKPWGQWNHVEIKV
jgi:hypothetical protein